MFQKSKTKRFIALFVAFAMLATMFSAVTAFGATIELGAPDDENTAAWRQMRWNIGEDDDGPHRLSMEDFASASQLVLEFSSQPETIIYMILFGQGNDWNWSPSQHPVFEPDEDDFVTTVIVDLPAFPTFDAIVSDNNAALVLASSCLPDLFVSAHLVTGGATTQAPVEITPLPPVETPEPPAVATPVPVAQDGENVLELVLGSTAYTLNGASGILEVAAQSIDGRTMVPFRFIGDVMGIDVDWNPDTRTAYYLVPGQAPISVTIGQRIYDGGVYMGTPVIEGGRTLAPINYVASALGAVVGWNNVTRAVTVTFGGGAEEVVAPPVIEEECCDDEDHDHADENGEEDENGDENGNGDEAVASEGEPTGNVFRAQLINSDASIQFTADMVEGDTYTLTFWGRNAAGRDYMLAQWSHWPENYAALDGNEDGNPSPAGVWTFHEVEFTATGTDIQIVVANSAVGDAYYVAYVTVTAADGTAQAIPLSALRGHWDSGVITVGVVPA